MNAIIITLIAVGIILQASFIIIEHKEKWAAAVILKGLASAVFVALGIYCATKYGWNGYDKLVVTGLTFGLIGDVLLNLRFVLKKIGDKIFLGGIAAFFIGHVVYLIIVCNSAKHIIIDIVIGVLLTAALLTYIFKTMKVKTAFKIFGIFYLGAIIVMTVMAIDTAIYNPLTRHILFAVGAILFTASDVILIFNTFSGKETFGGRIANLSLYYVGQILIALTPWFYMSIYVS